MPGITALKMPAKIYSAGIQLSMRYLLLTGILQYPGTILVFPKLLFCCQI